MKSFPPAKIRNVALVGHGGSGKTTLAESLLFCAGAITRQGRVEDGSTVTDTEPEEIKRRISISLALAPFEFEGHKINILDCPGYADFIS
ncbi:MAG: elongation factor, partial [Actinomycetota bacterium]|nr:elongation factor [Actinomycetota bacterium]